MLATGEDLFKKNCEKDWCSYVEDYSLVIQEYFQERVRLWLKTVGKRIFKIKHHWLRYEFAKSRGQIHAHMLVIADNKDLQLRLYQLRHRPEDQAKLLSEWCRDSFGLTAEYDDDVASRCSECNPVDVYHSDTLDKESDAQGLLKKVQMHDCNGYCLRTTTKDQKETYCKTRGIKE